MSIQDAMKCVSILYVYDLDRNDLHAGDFAAAGATRAFRSPWTFGMHTAYSHGLCQVKEMFGNGMTMASRPAN